ncbi:hypothetical protein OPT61_g4557 [Boeremia exigua]|uniref:Uncharacterized protein n=1 Tax=Boeremia exigua TaxID=749465 RepID=A0ACC2IDJ7_9PLEO|nr:hypothetical protein OPT61_g4557 [Boeremia exigua]
MSIHVSDAVMSEHYAAVGVLGPSAHELAEDFEPTSWSKCTLEAPSGLGVPTSCHCATVSSLLFWPSMTCGDRTRSSLKTTRIPGDLKSPAWGFLLREIAFAQFEKDRSPKC